MGFQMDSPGSGWWAAVGEPVVALFTEKLVLEGTSGDQLVQLPWPCVVRF